RSKSSAPLLPIVMIRFERLLPRQRRRWIGPRRFGAWRRRDVGVNQICPTTGLFLPTGEGQPRPAEQERHNDRHGALPAEWQPGASFVSRRRRRQAGHKRWRPAFVIASQLLEQLPYCSLFQILLHRKLHSLP